MFTGKVTHPGELKTRDEIEKYRLNTSLEDQLKDAPFLLKMANHALSLHFEQEPNYNYLKFYFEKNIMELDIVPSIYIDWEPSNNF